MGENNHQERNFDAIPAVVFKNIRTMERRYNLPTHGSFVKKFFEKELG